MTSGTWARHHERSGDYDVTDLGFNYRMDEAHAALGSALLRDLPEGNDRRRAATDRYRDGLDGVATVSGVGVRARTESAYHLLALALPTHADRGAVRELLANDGVQTSVHYPPIHRLSAFEAHPAALPVTEEFGERELTLPLYPHITSAQIDRVIDSLRAALLGAGGSARREG
jgi:dTDP-4-amino-4,6-dideoxygalactose transaminase